MKLMKGLAASLALAVLFSPKVTSWQVANQDTHPVVSGTGFN